MDEEIQDYTAKNEISLQESQYLQYLGQIYNERTFQNKKVSIKMQEEIERRKKTEIIDMRKSRSVPFLDMKLSTLLSRRSLDENLAITQENESCSLNQLRKGKNSQKFPRTSYQSNQLLRKIGKNEKSEEIKVAEQNQIKKDCRINQKSQPEEICFVDFSFFIGLIIFNICLFIVQRLVFSN